MDGRQKVATLLLALEPEVAAALLARFGEEQKAEIVEAMVAIDYVDHETVQEVLTEFEQLCGMELHAITEPKARVRAILAYRGARDEGRGEERTDAKSSSLDPRPSTPVPDLAALLEDRGSAGSPFAALERLEADQLSDLLGEEHPQTVAIVLSRLSAAKAGRVLSLLPADLSSDVVRRMVTFQAGTPPEVIESIGRVLGQRAQAMVSASDPWASPQRRHQLVAGLLAMTGRTAREAALGAVREHDPEVGDHVRSLMFLFEDLPLLEPTALRNVIGAVDTQTVAMALKTASDDVKECIFNAISSRAAQTIREEQELLGPRPISEVEAAQQAFVDAVNRLVEKGEITIKRGGGGAAEEEMV